MAIARVHAATAQSGQAHAEAQSGAGGADPSYWLLAIAMVVVGDLLGWLISSARNPPVFHPNPGVGIFAVVYIVAQGIERVLEPVAGLLEVSQATDKVVGGNKRHRMDARDAAVANAIAAGPNDHQAVAVAAEKQSALDRLRANRTAVMWGLASALAMVSSGFFGLYLLRAVGLRDTPYAIEILVTGLAIGGGTKPLHDLITNLQSSSHRKQDPPETGGH